jgi:hypothetical protein
MTLTTLQLVVQNPQGQRLTTAMAHIGYPNQDPPIVIDDTDEVDRDWDERHANHDGWIGFQKCEPGKTFVLVRCVGYRDYLLDVTMPHDETITVTLDRAPLAEVRVSGVDFVAGGKRLVFREVTNFLQFYRVAVREEDPAPTLYKGIDLDRVTLTMKWVPEQLGWPVLNPLHDLLRFQQQLRDYLAWKRSIGRRSELTVICDAYDLGLSKEDQARILNATYEVATDYRDVAIVEFGNEVEDGENRLDLPWLIANVNRRGVISSSGSGLSGGPVPTPYLDYCTPHLCRPGNDDQALGKMLADINFGEQVYGSWAAHPIPTKRPMLTNEMIGAHETRDDGSRCNRPAVFRELGRGCRARGGGAFHAEDAVYSRALGPRQEECLAAFVEE